MCIHRNITQSHQTYIYFLPTFQRMVVTEELNLQNQSNLLLSLLPVARPVEFLLMGQSFSATLTSPVPINREIQSCSRFVLFDLLSPDEKGGRESEVEDYLDYTYVLPDECLEYIFHFLSSSDRKICSLVSKRWFLVDGQSRHRLSLNAQSQITPVLPSIFARFDSVTKLTLRCERKSPSVTDEALLLISLRCRNLTRFKIRGCREITDNGISTFAMNCKGLKKLSCGSCMFGAVGLNAVLKFCTNLEELSVKRLRGVHDSAETIEPGRETASSLKSICLKELINGQCFAPLIMRSINLKTLKVFRCLGDWDSIFELMAEKNRNLDLVEIHLERLQVSDLGLSAISKSLNLEILRIVKTPECSNFGLACIAENCKQLKRLHIDGWRTNRIDDQGLIAVAKQCTNLEELVLIGVNPTLLSLAPLASNCQKLERLALCGSGTVGDLEIACIAAKCVALKKLCIKGCPISNIGVEALAWGCPNLAKIKVKKCIGVTGEVAGWLQEKRGSLTINCESCETDYFDATGINVEAQENGMPIYNHGATGESREVANGRNAQLWTQLGLQSGRNFLSRTVRRWYDGDSSGGLQMVDSPTTMLIEEWDQH